MIIISLLLLECLIFARHFICCLISSLQQSAIRFYCTFILQIHAVFLDIFLHNSVLIAVSFFVPLLNSNCDPSVVFRIVSSLWTTSFPFYPTVNKSCVLSNRTSSDKAWIWISPWNFSQVLLVFFLFSCLSSGSASVHLCLLFSHSHFFCAFVLSSTF